MFWDTPPLSSISSLRQRSSDKFIAIKSKTIIYPTDILDQRELKNPKPKIFQLFIEPESYISGSTENIIRDQLIVSYDSLPNPKDQILYLI